MSISLNGVTISNNQIFKTKKVDGVITVHCRPNMETNDHLIIEDAVLNLKIDIRKVTTTTKRKAETVTALEQVAKRRCKALAVDVVKYVYTFEENDIVLAKMRGYCEWPSYVIMNIQSL